VNADVFAIFETWLEWVVSHDGRLHRRANGQLETDMDLLALIPTPPGQSIFTVGDLRALVAAGKEWREMRQLASVGRAWGEAGRKGGAG
jgi:hypothetical protein